MSVTWHIVQKDLRRMAVPVAIWCGLIAVVSVTLRTAPMTVDLGPVAATVGALGAAVAAGSQWINGFETFVGVAIAMQTCTAAILAAFFIQQDPMTGSRAFWHTRPISDGRMLRAKFLGGALLFAFAPSLVVAAVGWSFGFSFHEGLSAALQFMVWHVIAVSIGFAVGSITANLGTFLFAALLGGAVFPAVAVVINSRVGHSAGRLFTLKCLLMAGPLFVYLAQALGRRQKLGWWAYGAVVVVAVMSAIGMPRLIDQIAWHVNNRSRIGGPVTAIDRTLVVRLAPGDPGAPHGLRATVERAPTQDLTPVVLFAGGRVPGENRNLAWAAGARWGDVPALRLIDADSGLAPPTWQLEGRSDQLQPDFAHLQNASAVVAWTRPLVLWETPIEVGRKVTAGSSSTVVVAITGEAHGWVILLRELDARAWWRTWPNMGSVADTRENFRVHDCFILRDSVHGTAEAVEQSYIRSVSLNGMMVTVRVLRLTPGEPDMAANLSLRNKTLVKVRFLGDREFITKAVVVGHPGLRDSQNSGQP